MAARRHRRRRLLPLPEIGQLTSWRDSCVSSPESPRVAVGHVTTTPFWTQGPSLPSSRAGHRYVWMISCRTQSSISAEERVALNEIRRKIQHSPLLFSAFFCFPGPGSTRGSGRGGPGGSAAPRTRWRTPGSANLTRKSQNVSV